MESKKRESLRNKHEDHYLPGKADTCAGFHPDNFEDRVQQYLSAVIPGMLHNKTQILHLYRIDNREILINMIPTSTAAE